MIANVSCRCPGCPACQVDGLCRLRVPSLPSAYLVREYAGAVKLLSDPGRRLDRVGLLLELERLVMRLQQELPRGERLCDACWRATLGSELLEDACTAIDHFALQGDRSRWTKEVRRSPNPHRTPLGDKVIERAACRRCECPIILTLYPAELREAAP